MEKNALIEAALPLVGKIAEEYEGCGLSFDDLAQIGCIGLIKAIDEGTDPEPVIRKEIDEAVRRL